MHSTENLLDKSLSMNAYSDLRQREKTLENAIRKLSGNKRTRKEMTFALHCQLLYHMEHSEGIYVKYGAEAFWRFCEATSYIFGKNQWRTQWNSALQDSVLLTGKYYPEAYGLLPTYTTEQFSKLIELCEQAMIFQNRRKKKAEAKAKAEAVNN